MNAPLAFLLVFAGCSVAAWAICSVLVVVLDAAGLVWRADAEAKRHPPESLSAHARRRVGG